MRWAALVWLLSMMAASAAEGQTCFCLGHPITGAVVRYGCTETVPRNRFTPIVSCMEPERRGPKEIIADPGRWSRLAEGEGACNPCAPGPDEPLPDVPRNLERVDSGG